MEAEAVDFLKEPPVLNGNVASEARLFFNATGTGWNATTTALTAGAILFIMLNTLFVIFFVSPNASSKADNEDNETNDYEYYNNQDFYDDEVRKKKKR